MQAKSEENRDFEKKMDRATHGDSNEKKYRLPPSYNAHHSHPSSSSDFGAGTARNALLGCHAHLAKTLRRGELRRR